MSRGFGLIVAALVWVGGMVSAQEELSYDPTVLDVCLSGRVTASERAGCIGQAAARCVDSELGGSTVGMRYCLGSEAEDWDARLNAVYQHLLVEQAEMDADHAQYAPHLPSAVETMREMQRSWIAYRDAACSWEVLQFGGGTGGGPARAACMMELTARQTLFLEQRLAP